jgi:hypothetical protein
MKQMRTGVVVDYKKIRARCEEIATFVEEVLSSPVFNVTLGSFATLNYIECNSPIRKRIPVGQNEVNAQCYQCKASYTINDEGEGKVKWTPHQHKIECANANCQKKIVVWQHELEVGRYWKCTDCGGENYLVLSIQYKNTPNKKINKDGQKRRNFRKTRKNSATSARQLFKRYAQKW